MFRTKSHIVLHAVTLTMYNLKSQLSTSDSDISGFRRFVADCILNCLAVKVAAPAIQAQHIYGLNGFFTSSLQLFFFAHSSVSQPKLENEILADYKVDFSGKWGKAMNPMQPKHLCLRVFKRPENLLSSSPSSWPASVPKLTDFPFS